VIAVVDVLLKQSTLIVPTWSVPSSIVAFTTTREGGVSLSPYDNFNLAAHVGDDEKAVLENRTRLKENLTLPAEPYWLSQTHSTIVRYANQNYSLQEADASFTEQKNILCAVLTADCLPLLVAHKDALEVAAIHAGWKGLLNGVIEATFEKLRYPASEYLVWLGPAISPKVYEIGAEVREAFIAKNKEASEGFLYRDNKWYLDIYTLAKQRLKALGVQDISGSDHCTFSEKDLFFSYRRDNITGRMASCIYIKESMND
jgi:YfiH family protein